MTTKHDTDPIFCAVDLTDETIAALTAGIKAAVVHAAKAWDTEAIGWNPTADFEEGDTVAYVFTYEIAAIHEKHGYAIFGRTMTVKVDLATLATSEADDE